MKYFFLVFFLTLIYMSGFCQSTDEIYSISLYETHFNDPDKILELIEDAINNNDVYKFLSYFPLKIDLKEKNFSDMATYVGIINDGNLYFPQYDQILPNRLIARYSKGYYNIKKKLLILYYPDFKSPLMLKENDDPEKIRLIIEETMKNPIKITLTKKLTYDRSSLYKYTEAYIYICNLYSGEDFISDMLVIRVEKINNQWRVIQVYL